MPRKSPTSSRRFPPAERPGRTVLFMAFTAEEQGLLGSEYYCGHPLYPLTKTLADINIDGTGGPADRRGRPATSRSEGYGNSTLDDVAAAAPAEARPRRVLPDPPRAGEGLFLPGGPLGVREGGRAGWLPPPPAHDIIGKPAGYGRMALETRYIADDYHKVS